MQLAKQPVPQVNENDVERVVRRDFPADDYDAVMTILDMYGTEAWQRECARVQLAALKLANSSLERLRSCIEIAKTDYRDVLSPAEYPAYRKIGWSQIRKLATEEQGNIIDSDRRQYEEWLNRAL